MKKTIYDIAKELGVAPSTVSKALNGGTGVSEKTRKKIIRYANKVRYIPNASASLLKTKRSYSIGIIFSEELNIGLEHYFFSSVIQSFKDHVEKEGYEIQFVIKHVGKTEMTYLEFCRYKNLDGVFIIVADSTDKDLDELINSDIPCVTTDMINDNVYTVMTDNVFGGKLAVQKLYDLGHRRIGHIAGPVHSIAGKERIEGFKLGMKEVGLECTDDLIMYADQFSFVDGYRAVTQFFTLKERPTALFVGSDDIAMGVIKRLRENGFKVPEDVAVIGFDDHPFVKYFEPAISTLKQEKHLLGIEAAKYLIDCIEKGEVTDTTELRIKPVYISRESA